MMGYPLLMALCFIGIYVLILCIKAISNNRYKLLHSICIVLFGFTILRYLTLIVYGNHPTMDQLEAVRYFYFASSIGLTIPTVLAVWYISPFLRSRIQLPYYLACFTPWILFDLYLILRQPTKIQQGKSYGYVLRLVEPFNRYLSVVQGSLVVIICLLCLIGLVKYGHVQMRVQYSIIILAQLILVLDGMTAYKEMVQTIPPFTVSEIGGFLAVYYAFKLPIIEIKGIKNT